jgi:hypothetical protein
MRLNAHLFGVAGAVDALYDGASGLFLASDDLETVRLRALNLFAYPTAAALPAVVNCQAPGGVVLVAARQGKTPHQSCALPVESTPA